MFEVTDRCDICVFPNTTNQPKSLLHLTAFGRLKDTKVSRGKFIGGLNVDVQIGYEPQILPMASNYSLRAAESWQSRESKKNDTGFVYGSSLYHLTRPFLCYERIQQVANI